jgi:hypothetical protein
MIEGSKPATGTWTDKLPFRKIKFYIFSKLFLSSREYKPPASFDVPEDMRITLFEWEKNSGTNRPNKLVCLSPASLSSLV